MEDVKVSVLCIAYNHEKYIRQALESVVMQKTNFPYEIIVHDDASTDNTAQIIMEYENKYPNLIKAICQKENQFSKAVPILKEYILPQVKGKYIAYLECDDYWTNPLKLQKQFDELENRPDIDMCAHAVVKVQNEREVEVVSPSDVQTVLTPEQVISGGGGYLMTNSLFYRRELAECFPRFREYLSIDYSLQIQGSLRGGILYIPDNMAVYRAFSGPQSWTSRMKNNPEKKTKHSRKTIEMLKILNADTNKKFDQIIQGKIKDLEFSILFNNKHYKEMLNKDYKNSFKKCSFKKKCYIYFGALFLNSTENI